ncbi:MAG: AMP-binding protein, partial [Prevotella sp.]|nr:AMP-binding protein [Prevotella sp.]
MVERFLKQTHFESVEDYNQHLEFIIPENFNFAYDVMDAWAEEKPDGLALLWTNDQGEEIRTTFGELKEQTDQAASYLQTLGIGKNDPVMLILKRRYEWWVVMLALHKIGAIVIPATHMLTKHDIVYRNTRASVKAIICVDDPYVVSQIQAAKDESPTVKQYITITDHGKPIPEGFHDWQSEWQQAPQFQRPAFVNTNDDTMLMYFTSGTSGEPKMVAH